MSDNVRPPQIARCQETIERGGILWQCLDGFHADDIAHRFAPDAEFGRVLHDQRPDWLAAVLRDQVALRRNAQRRADDLQAMLIDLSRVYAGGGQPEPATMAWLAINLPSTARLIGAL